MSTIVDDDVAVWLSNRNPVMGKNGYVKLGNHRALHSYVNNTPSGYHTDHINGDKLDNRRDNLRTTTGSENGHNRHGLNKNNTSGFSGIHFDLSRSQWMASIKIDRKRIQLGRYARLEDALIARNAAEKVVKSWKP